MALKDLSRIMDIKFGVAKFNTDDLENGSNYVNVEDINGQNMTILVTAYTYITHRIIPDIMGCTEQEMAGKNFTLPIICTNDNNESLVITASSRKSENTHLILIYSNEKNDPDLISEARQYYNMFKFEHSYTLK